MRLVSVFCFCMAIVLHGAVASAYDCSQGGEQVSTSSSVALLYGDRPSSSGQTIVVLRSETTRSVADSSACPGWVRIESWLDEGDGAVHKQSENVARIGAPVNTLEVAKSIQHVEVRGSGFFGPNPP
jgi:hypothetical protein